MALPKSPPQTEGELQRWFVRELGNHRFLSYKFASPARRGVPDLIIIDRWGQVSFVEMKHPNGKGVISPLQKVQIRELLDSHAKVYIAESVQDCMDIIKHEKKGVTYAEL